MSMRDLLPWSRAGETAPAPGRGGEWSPFLSLHRDVNRLFDEVFRRFDRPSGAAWPRVEVVETDGDLRVTAEVPGLDEKDIEVLLDDGVLTLRGETRDETNDAERRFSERCYGRFERRIALDREIEQERVGATFRNGLLTVVLPKSARARTSARRIAIDAQH